MGISAPKENIWSPPLPQISRKNTLPAPRPHAPSPARHAPPGFSVQTDPLPPSLAHRLPLPQTGKNIRNIHQVTLLATKEMHINVV